MRLVFCGTPQFAVPSLRALCDAGHRVELVLSQPDRASGRGLEVHASPVKQFAGEQHLPLLQPEKIRNNVELEQRVREISPDAIIVVAYGRLIPPWMLALPRYGNLNLHGSLLPKYRGAAPIQWAIANGETETGLTTMRLDEGLDTGDILLQERVPIVPDQTSVELAPILAGVGANLLVKTLADLEGGSLRAMPQDNSRATLAPILKREDGRVDWRRSAAQIQNRWRGFQPWPGAFTLFRGKKLTLHALRVADAAVRRLKNAAPGTLMQDGRDLFAACGEGSWLQVLEVQLEGKRRLPADAFLRGVVLAPGERLG
ncbi:MAG TPA: methionyl-tRNA formyltransferase [Acidobacteriaceae bacterium]|nr:methionyl-tRNA formyltransferase [Acidobacteriaceae bacterium]